MAAPTDAVQVVAMAVFVFVTLEDGLADAVCRESHVQIWPQQVQSLLSAGCALRSRRATPFNRNGTARAATIPELFNSSVHFAFAPGGNS